MAKHVLKKEKRPVTRVLKILYIALVVLAVIIVAGFAAYKAFVRAPDVDEQVTFPISSSSPAPASSGSPGVSKAPAANPSEDVAVFTRREGVYTCLLLGVADFGGSDTIMLGCFDTKNKSASLISIPRDTLVLYKGENSKINALYSYGGSEAMVDAVSGMLGIPVDFYMSVNLKAFRKIVDTIGGVYFDVPVNMNYDDPTQNLSIHVKKGYQLLNGKQAEGVMRDRKDYPDGDIGRQRTQRAFLAALVKQAITPSNVTKVTELINILSKYVESDMPLDTMVYFATEAIGMDLDTALTTDSLPGTWKYPYEETDDEAALEMVNELLPVYTEPITADIMDIHHR